MDNEDDDVDELFYDAVRIVLEENSASAEEVNATVQVHNEKLQDMMEKIGSFKEISVRFSKELGRYKI